MGSSGYYSFSFLKTRGKSEIYIFMTNCNVALKAWSKRYMLSSKGKKWDCFSPSKHKSENSRKKIGFFFNLVCLLCSRRHIYQSLKQKIIACFELLQKLCGKKNSLIKIWVKKSEKKFAHQNCGNLFKRYKSGAWNHVTILIYNW